ncbi:hypothetical protein B0H13DRAFT_1860297 [Mycena leptocephala]|nr:hypothetical protein B0H13DRAFT_1860297 [Mycena leptocephala]
MAQFGVQNSAQSRHILNPRKLGRSEIRAKSAQEKIAQSHGQEVTKYTGVKEQNEEEINTRSQRTILGTANRSGCTHTRSTYRRPTGVNPSNSTINMINWVQVQQDVWMVLNEQLLVCKTRARLAARPGVSAQVLHTSSRRDGKNLQWHPVERGRPPLALRLRRLPFLYLRKLLVPSCYYGSPEIELTVYNPNPAEQVPNGQQVRFQLPTAAPAPSETRLLENVSAHQAPARRPISPNGANLTGGTA